MATCQQFKGAPGGTQQLTNWKGFHGSMSRIQVETGGTQELTVWKVCYGNISTIQVKPGRHTETHHLEGILWQPHPLEGIL